MSKFHYLVLRNLDCGYLKKISSLILIFFQTLSAWKITGRLVTVAFLYTIPWDNMLVYKAGWSYIPDRVLYTIGYVPIEEYAFFVIETVIICGIVTQMIGGQCLYLFSTE